MVKKGLNERLREARARKGFSQQYVADTLSVSRQSISNWEAGRGYPDLDNVVLLSDLYGVSLDWLLKEEKSEGAVKGVVISEELKEVVASESQKEKKDRTFQEVLSILLLLVLSCHLPFVGVCVAIAVAVWMKKTERKYKWMYVVCVCVSILGIYNTFVVLDHLLFDYGVSIIEQMSSLL